MNPGSYEIIMKSYEIIFVSGPYGTIWALDWTRGATKIWSQGLGKYPFQFKFSLINLVSTLITVLVERKLSSELPNPISG